MSSAVRSLETILMEKYGRAALSIEEVAAILSVSKKDVIMELGNGNLLGRIVGTRTVIPVQVLASYLGRENIKERADNEATNAVTSTENTFIIEDDVDMSQGSITYVKGSNRWLYQIDLGKDSNGKRIRKSRSFTSEEDAREALALELAKLNRSEQIEEGVEWKGKIINGNTSLYDYFDYYLSLSTAKPRTVKTYYESARRVTKVMGDTPINKLTPESIIMFFNEFKKNYGQQVIDKTYGVFKRALEYAKDRDLIEKNPFKSVTKPKTIKESELNKNPYKAFKDDELKEVLQACKFVKDLYPIVKLLQYTGLRPGELRALEWDNLDLDNKTVTIKQAATQDIKSISLENHGGVTDIVGPTKSKYSVRTIPINDEVVLILKEWKEYLESSREYKKARNSQYVFPSTKGTMLGKTGLELRFKKTMKKFGIYGKGYRLYTFRHTFCTALIKQRVDISTVQRLMGDSTTDVILKIYRSVDSKDIKRAAEKLKDYFME